MSANSNTGAELAAAERGRQTFKVSDHIRLVHNSDGATLLDIRLGQVFTVNLAGSRIFQLLNERVEETEIIARICREFGISAEMATADVRDFLVAVYRNGLIETTADMGR
jgi:hypothetical protein